MKTRFHLAGHHFWAPGFDSIAALEAATEDPSIQRPAIDIVESRMKRATSLMTRMAVECVEGARVDAGFEAGTSATLFGSQHGEIQIAVEQMEMMHEQDEALDEIDADLLARKVLQRCAEFDAEAVACAAVDFAVQ